VRSLRRIGKRIAIGVEGDLWLVLHLMIAGRLHWRPPQVKLAGRQSLAAFDFPSGFSQGERGAKASRSVEKTHSSEDRFRVGLLCHAHMSEARPCCLPRENHVSTEESRSRQTLPACQFDLRRAPVRRPAIMRAATSHRSPSTPMAMRFANTRRDSHYAASTLEARTAVAKQEDTARRTRSIGCPTSGSERRYRRMSGVPAIGSLPLWIVLAHPLRKEPRHGGAPEFLVKASRWLRLGQGFLEPFM